MSQNAKNTGDLVEVTTKLAEVVGDLQLRVADLEDRLEKADVRHRTNRTYPEPEYRLYVPQSKFKD
jgi:hypothetical protein